MKIVIILENLSLDFLLELDYSGRLSSRHPNTEIHEGDDNFPDTASQRGHYLRCVELFVLRARLT